MITNLQIALLFLLISKFSSAQLTEAVDFTIVDINNDTTQLFNLLDSGQFVLMDCGAWWCAPCRQSIPALKDYWNKYAKDNGCLHILSLDVASGETIPTLNNQIINDTIPYSVFAMSNNNDQLDNICWQYTNNSAVPQFILINPDKTIPYIRIGSLTGNNATYLDSVIAYNFKYSTCFSPKKSESPNKELHIYPNPFNTNVNFEIEIKKYTDLQISIYDNTGRLINQYERKKIMMGNYTKQINTESFRAGLYFLVINLNGKIQLKKIVKNSLFILVLKSKD
jgi:thiol-disulfide isomerase/thioredoxin